MRSPRRLFPFAFAASSVVACGGITAGSSSDGGVGAETAGPCGAGQIDCPHGGCTDLATDLYNCGSCSLACVGSGQACVAGQCTGGTPPSPGPDGGGSSVPPNPGGPTPSGNGSTVLAISKFYYGDTDRKGVTSPDAWQAYGLNIDGKVTTKTSTDVCTLAAGATKTAQVDGTNGIDNSFGENILPIIITINGSSFSQTANENIQQGGTTMMIRLDQLGSDPDYSPLPGLGYRAGPTTSPPAWSGSDVRTIDSESLKGGNPATPSLSFVGGYMNSRVWVGVPPVDNTGFDMHFWNAEASTVPMTHVQLTMLVDANNASATQGVLSGILNTNQFVLYLQMIAGSISSSLCNGSAFQSIAQQIEQASDIMIDGTNQPGVPCNGISLGLGFDAAAVQLGSVVTLPPPANPCQ
jgi:hypothetical protein